MALSNTLSPKTSPHSEKGLRSAVIEAVTTATEKSKSMTK